MTGNERTSEQRRCPFCTIDDSLIVAPNTTAIAFHDAYPIAEGHTLVIPRQHITSIFDLSDSDQAQLWQLVLMCPAWKRSGTATTVNSNTTILHNRADDVVPLPDSRELVASSGLPTSALVEVGDDHRLASADALATMLEVVEKVGG